MPSGSSSSDLSAMSLDISFKDLSGVLGTVGSGSGVVCEGEGGEERRGRRKGGWRVGGEGRRRGREERDESEERKEREGGREENEKREGEEGRRRGKEEREGGRGGKEGREERKREKRETRVKQHCRMAAVASQEYSLLCPIWGPTHMESYQS